MKEATKEEEKKDLQIKDALSMNAWMAVLSSEINRNQAFISHLMSLVLAGVALTVAAIYGANVLLKDDHIMMFLASVLLFFISFAYVTSIYERRQHKKRIETLESIREDAITGNIDTKEITRRWSKEYKKL